MFDIQRIIDLPAIPSQPSYRRWGSRLVVLVAVLLSPTLAYSEIIETLPNGLQVIVKANQIAPVADVRIYVKTGSIYEQEYLGSGISHVFEHLINGGTTRNYTEDQINDMIDRLKRYTDSRAADLVASGTPLPPMWSTLRRSTGRFIKCYFLRKGYREGAWGFAIALMAALYPLISHLKATVELSGDERS